MSTKENGEHKLANISDTTFPRLWTLERVCEGLPAGPGRGVPWPTQHQRETQSVHKTPTPNTEKTQKLTLTQHDSLHLTTLEILDTSYWGHTENYPRRSLTYWPWAENCIPIRNNILIIGYILQTVLTPKKQRAQKKRNILKPWHAFGTANECQSNNSKEIIKPNFHLTRVHVT